jgi:hypothetical protein
LGGTPNGNNYSAQSIVIVHGELHLVPAASLGLMSEWRWVAVGEGIEVEYACLVTHHSSGYTEPVHSIAISQD